MLTVIGRYADEATWTKLHDAGLKTTSIEEKQNYYDALAFAADPKLAAAHIADRADRRAAFEPRGVSWCRKSRATAGMPISSWQFAKANMKPLLAKTDALGALSYAPSLFTFFSDPARTR